MQDVLRTNEKVGPGERNTAPGSSLYSKLPWVLDSQDLFPCTISSSNKENEKKHLAFSSKAPCVCTHFSTDLTKVSSSSKMAENKQGMLP